MGFMCQCVISMSILALQKTLQPRTLFEAYGELSYMFGSHRLLPCQIP